MRTPVLVSAVVATVAVAGVATASIPASDGSIVACYERPNAQKGDPAGPLRPVESASECTASENAVTIGARGAQGPPGSDGQNVTAEPPQVFENNFNGLLPGGRYSALPNDGTPFTIGVDVPAGTYVVLAQANMNGHMSFTRRYPLSGSRTSYFGLQVTCTLAGAGQSNATTNYVEFGSTWTQNLTVTLTAPGRITMECKTPKFEPESREDIQWAGVQSLRLSATRLPQTRVTRTITLAATLASLPGTTERRPPTTVRIQDLEAAEQRDELNAIARALRAAGH